MNSKQVKTLVYFFALEFVLIAMMVSCILKEGPK